MRMTNGEVKGMKSVWQRDWLVKTVWKGRGGWRKGKGETRSFYLCLAAQTLLPPFKTFKVAYLCSCYVHAMYMLCMYIQLNICHDSLIVGTHESMNVEVVPSLIPKLSLLRRGRAWYILSCA